MVSIGLADPRLIDYITNLLVRFIHIDVIYRLRSNTGRRLEEVAEMLAEAEGRIANAQREVHRHIGDVTLFWTGVYPEALPLLRHRLSQDHLLDYTEQGKRSYWIASTFDDEPYREEAPTLRRLSKEFEVCAFGLNQVRAEWERIGGETAQQFRRELLAE